jgi:hypothetical protein
VKDNGKTTMVPVFQSLETISGEVFICLVPYSYVPSLASVLNSAEMVVRYL